MNNLKTLTIAYLIVCLLCSFDCRNSGEKRNLIEVPDWQEAVSGNVAVYVEAHNKNEYFGEGDFGDIVLFNIDTRKKFYITRDSYIDEQPALSPDRNYVIFSTARIGNPLVLKVRGLGGPRELFKYDFRTNKLSWFAKSFQMKYPKDMHRFENICWSPDTKVIFYSSFGKVFRFSLEEGVLQTFLNFRENNIVFRISLTHDGSKLAVNYADNRFKIDIVNTDDKSTHEIINWEGGVLLGTWSPDGKKLVYNLFQNRRYTWFEYNIETNSSDTLHLPGLNSTIDVTRACYINSTELLLLAGRAMYPADSTREATAKNYELVKFNLESKQYDWLTDDGYAKGDLQVYPSKNK